MEKTFKIESFKIDRLTADVAKINRKAAKLGCSPVGFECGAPYNEPGVVVTDDESFAACGALEGINCRKVVRTFVNVKVFGETPKLAGWEFIGVIVPMGVGNILKIVGNEEVPEAYRTAEPKCDHCKTIRRRNETYLVRHESGEWKQVGSTCIEDFLGGLSVEAVAGALEMILGVIGRCLSDEDEIGGCMSSPWQVGVEDFLALAASFIREGGYVKSGDIRDREPTGRTTLNAYFDTQAYKIEWPKENEVASA